MLRMLNKSNKAFAVVRISETNKRVLLQRHVLFALTLNWDNVDCFK